MAPRITMIIPTRERHDTLRWALKTCVTQDHDDFEILVSDNASVDATREVVDSYDDKRIRYVNPGRRLGMSEHWEFALSHVRDGYVGFLGDDDGMMPGSVRDISDIVGSSRTEALIWPLMAYYWPQYLDSALANCISVPLPQPRGTRTLTSRSVLKNVANLNSPYHLLPSPYWGVVSVDTIRRVTSRSGTFFHSITPDIYSGAAIAALLPQYLRSGRSLTLSGASKHSNGASQMHAGTARDVEVSSAFVEESSIPFHPDLDYVGNFPLLITEVLFQVRDHVDATAPVPSPERVIDAALVHADFLFNRAIHDDVLQALGSMAERNGRTGHLQNAVRRSNRYRLPRTLIAAFNNVVRGNPLIDFEPLGVRNVYDATLAAHDVLARTTTIRASRGAQLRGRSMKLRRASRVAYARLRRNRPG